MKTEELNALVALLDDDDAEVASLVEERLMRAGEPKIQELENHWENTDNCVLQSRLEHVIERIKLNELETDFRFWAEMESDDLLKGMWIVSRTAYPDYPLETLQEEISQLYHNAWASTTTQGNAKDTLQSLNDFLFRKKRFGPNKKGFHLPSNSLINRVLETRQGNPLTLCVVYLLVAQRMGLPVHGVNLPNIFVMMYKDEEQEFYINAFNKGSFLSRKDLEDYVSTLPITAKPDQFEPCDNKVIMARGIRNLIVAYHKTNPDRCRQLKSLLDILVTYMR